MRLAILGQLGNPHQDDPGRDKFQTYGIEVGAIFSNQQGRGCQIPTPILPQAKFCPQKRPTLSRKPLICMVPAPGIEPGTY